MRYLFETTKALIDKDFQFSLPTLFFQNIDYQQFPSSSQLRIILSKFLCLSKPCVSRISQFFPFSYPIYIGRKNGISEKPTEGDKP